MTEYICHFHDYLGDIHPNEKLELLARHNLEAKPIRQTSLQVEDREYSRFPRASYQSLVAEARSRFGRVAPQVLAGMSQVGPDSAMASQLSPNSREMLYSMRDLSSMDRFRMDTWALEERNWFLVNDQRGGFELQSLVSEDFPTLFFENGPFECSAPLNLDVRLENLDELLNATGVHQIWHRGHMGEGSTIAILDTGVSSSFYGSDYATSCSGVGGLDEYDVDGHGTAIASLIRALAPHASIHSIRVLDGYSGGQIWNLLSALTGLHGRTGLIVNMSLGVSPSWLAGLGAQSIAFKESISNLLSSLAAQQGFPICAAGNDGTSTLRWPAASNTGLAIGSHSASGSLSSFSNFSVGASNFVLAPGGERRDQDGKVFGFGGYGHGQSRAVYGTSFSAATASGISALLNEYGWFSEMQIASRVSLFKNHCRANPEGWPMLNVSDIGAVWPV